MAKTLLLDPAGLRERLRARWRRQRTAWLTNAADWPQRFPLGVPSEREALARNDALRHWIEAWRGYAGPGEIEWIERRWPSLGAQRLPAAIRLDDPADAAAILGVRHDWQRAVRRRRLVAERWPALADEAARHWVVLAEWEEDDFSRLIDVLEWLHAHPDSGLWPRQIPVAGVDSKWLESHKKTLTRWLSLLRGVEASDLLRLAGLRTMPDRLRMRLLDPALRQNLGGLADIEAPLSEIASLRLPVRRAFIIENLQTGLAFGDLPGTVVFMGRGYAVDGFGHIPWLEAIPVFYWGDLDTHGLVILARCRRHVPHIRSLLMDEPTLLRHRPLWGHEERPASPDAPAGLTDEEQSLYRDLRNGRWGPNIRLEQERIEWGFAWESVRRVCMPEKEHDRA